MIINCDSCGRSTSNRLHNCPYCAFAIKKDNVRHIEHSPREILFTLKHTSIRKLT